MKYASLIAAAVLTCTGIASATPIAPPTHYSVQHHPVSTSSAQAQAAFDEGLTLLYSYSRLAARAAFQRAAAADPRLAMAFWGIAASYGSNVNVPIDEAGEKAAYDAIVHAKSLTSSASDEEAAYIGALAVRFTNAPHPDYAGLTRAYERAMSDLKNRYPDDLDAATLYADSVLNLHPWAWFNNAGQPAEGMNDAIATLESVLARDPMHIGANHLYIHATEMSKTPERAVLSAQRLGTFSFEPAAAHLVHMPAHTFMRTGYYDAAVESNVRATQLDRAYLDGTADPEQAGYYGHDLMFLNAAYQMEGSFAGASRSADELATQGMLVPKLFTLCLFSRWHDVLGLAAPKASGDEPLRVALWHYARGLAFAGTGDVSSAQRERQSLDDLSRTTSFPGVVGQYNGSKQIFGIALDVLDAKIELARNKPAAAVPLLVHAVKVQDGFLYIEPADWYYPVRESLGAAFLRAGDLKGAEHAFRDDLVRNPRNGRSLFGLAKALDAEGDATDAAWARRDFVAAWQNADVDLSIDDL